MRVGIFAGGFKPFHVGHFSRLCQAIDSCDKTYVFTEAQVERKAQALILQKTMLHLFLI